MWGAILAGQEEIWFIGLTRQSGKKSLCLIILLSAAIYLVFSTQHIYISYPVSWATLETLRLMNDTAVSTVRATSLFVHNSNSCICAADFLTCQNLNRSKSSFPSVFRNTSVQNNTGVARFWNRHRKAKSETDTILDLGMCCLPQRLNPIQI